MDDPLIFVVDVCRSERVHERIERTRVHRLARQDDDEMVRERAPYEFDLAEGRRVGWTTEDDADVRGEGGGLDHCARAELVGRDHVDDGGADAEDVLDVAGQREERRLPVGSPDQLDPDR